ncbi:MAG: flippase [Ectothiorhodospiraceae bacterium]|nr:flippase [Ectothiorhodospiraceae bacterium]
MSSVAGIIIKNTSWMFLGKVGVLVINFLAILLVARHLGPELFGRLSFAIAGVALIAPVAQLGLHAIVTRDLVRSPGDREQILGTALSLRLMGGTLAVGLGLLLIWVLRPEDPALQLYFLLLLIGEALKSFMVFMHWMESEVNGRLVALCQLAVSLLLAFGRVACVFADAPLLAFVIVEALQGAFIAAMFGGAYMTSGNSLIRLRFSGAIARRLLRQCAPLMASGITAVIYLKIDQVMLGQMIGEAEVGVYALASRISDVWYFFPTMLVTSAFPFLLRHQETSRADYERMLQNLMDVLFWIGVAVALSVSLTAPFLMPLLFGEAYATTGYILAIHIWAGVFISMRALVSKWILAEGLLMFSLISQGSGAIANVALNLYLIPAWGGYGAAVATLISFAIATYFSLVVFRRTRYITTTMTRSVVAPVRLLLRGLHVHRN